MYPSAASLSSISDTEGADLPSLSAIRAWITGVPSSVRDWMVSRYSSRGGWNPPEEWESGTFTD